MEELKWKKEVCSVLEAAFFEDALQCSIFGSNKKRNEEELFAIFFRDFLLKMFVV